MARRRSDLADDSRGDIRLPPKRRNLAAKQVPHGQRWWRQDAEEAAQSVFANMAFWQNNQSQRLAKLRRFARIYGNLPTITALTTKSRAEIDQSRDLINPFSTNVTKSCVDTVAATVGDVRPKPFFVTSNSNWRGAQQCRELNRFNRGVMNEIGFDDKLVLQSFDALWAGVGFDYWYETLDHRVGMKRVLADQVWTDHYESIATHNPRELIILEQLDVDQCIAEYPDAPEKMILAAGNPFPSHPAPLMSTARLVTRLTAFRLPDGPDDPGGKLVCVSTGPLTDVTEFTRTYCPLTMLTFSESPEGYWPTGLVQELEPNQRELNSLNYTVKGSIDIAGTFKWFAKNSANLNPYHFTNALGAILTGDEAPQSLLAAIVQPEIYAWRQSIREEMYQTSGVSQAASSGVIPVGIKSGEAQRVNLDAYTKRFIKFARRVERQAVLAAQQIIDIVQDISDRGDKPGYEVRATSIDSIESINWKDLQYKPSIFSIQGFAISSLPNDPAGRKEEVLDRFARGWIDADTAMDLLDQPDVERFDTLFRQGRDRIVKCLDTIVQDGEYMGPDEYDDLPSAYVMGVRYLKLAQNQGAPVDRILLLKRYLTDVVAEQKKKMPTPGQTINPTPTPGAAQLSGFNPQQAVQPGAH